MHEMGRIQVGGHFFTLALIVVYILANQSISEGISPLCASYTKVIHPNDLRCPMTVNSIPGVLSSQSLQLINMPSGHFTVDGSTDVLGSEGAPFCSLTWPSMATS